jgi:predicted DNA-binding transcriptional regulator AlpA
MTRPAEEAVIAKSKGKFVASALPTLPDGNDDTGKPRGPPRLALSVPEFCEAVRISQSYFFQLMREGNGPKIMKVGSRTLISIEEAAAWCRRITEQSNPQ